MEKTKNVLRLLTNYFKKIGLAIILLSILFVVIVGIFFRETDFIQNHKLAMKIFSFDFLILGTFVICLSRDKEEDERIALLRTQSMALAFVFGVGFTIIGPLVDLVFGDPISKGDPHQIILTMIWVYLFWFIARKKSF
jgi:hypothetical membrane protein